MENASASTTLQDVDHQPELAESTTPEYDAILNPNTIFRLDGVEALRTHQYQAYMEARAKNLQDGFQEETAEFYARNAVKGTVDTYLADHGLSRDDENYNAYHKGLLSVSINETPEEEWYAVYKPGTTEQGQSGRDKVRALYAQFTGKPYYGEPGESTEAVAEESALTPNAEPEATTPEYVDPAIEAARLHLDTLRDELATLSAKRQSRIGGSGGEKYAEALEAYNAQVIALGRLEKAQLITDEETSDTAKKAEVVAYLFNEQNKLREVSIEKLQNTKVSVFINWMTSGTTLQRLGKGVIVGGVASLAGMGIGMLAGAAGVAAVGAGVAAAATGAVRFARGFARKDAKAGRGMQKLDDMSHLEAAQNVQADHPADYFETVHQHYVDTFERDTDNEQRKRRKSAAAGLAGIALGSAIGVGIGILSDTGVLEGAHEAIFGHDDIHSTIHTPEGHHYTHDYAAQHPATPETPPPAPVPEILPDPNYAISSGEGGLQLFGHLGLTSHDWYSVQQELVDKFPADFAHHGTDTWIMHTGQLSLPAQQFIKEHFNLP